MTHRRSSVTNQQRVVGGRFQLVCTIGSGAAAQVWRGVDLQSKQPIAVKVIKHDNARPANAKPKPRDPSQLDSPSPFDEPRVLRSLPPHPNVVDVAFVAASPHHLYLVQELCSKGDLLDLVTREWKANGSGNAALGESLARRLFADLVSAVHHLHANGVAHRDIKTDNCLVADDGRLVLADFGFATRSMACSRRCGTPHYMAPELFASDTSLYDPRKCDVWGCGVVLYAMLTARLPFDGATDAQLSRSVLAANFALPTGVSAEARDLLCALLAEHPAERPTIAQVKAHPFLALSGGTAAPLLAKGSV